MPRSDDSIFNSFYYFWKWEYLRRNNKHLKMVNIFLSHVWDLKIEQVNEKSYCVGASANELELLPGYHAGSSGKLIGDLHGHEFSLFVDEFMLTCFVPHKMNLSKDDYSYNCYTSSEEILSRCLSGNMAHLFPKINYEPRVIYTNADGKFFKIMKRAGFVQGQSFAGDIGPRTVLCAINMGRDLNDIIEDIKSLHSIYAKGELHTPSRETTKRVGAKKGMISRLPGRDDRDLTRAIGLWLWDYMENKKIPYKHKAKAFSAFEKLFQQTDSTPRVNGYDDHKQLAELLDLAINCIEKMEVLPGS